MTHTSGDDFIKRYKERSLAKSADVFVPPEKQASVDSVYTNSYSDESSSMQDEQSVKPPSSLKLPEPAPMRHAMNRKDKTKFLVMRTLGNFLILLSLYGVMATFGPALFYEVQFQAMKIRGVKFAVASPQAEFASVSTQQVQSPGFGDIIAGAQQQVLVPPNTQFSMVIPKIGATAQVWPNVDPLDEKDFLPKLQTGIAHAKGTVFPGMQGNVYLFAHSTDNFWDVGRYNAVFYLLKDLSPGDDISIYFEDSPYNYKVDHTVIKDPTDVDFLIHSQVPGQEQLILQTCWPPGTTWKRLFVIAKPV